MLFNCFVESVCEVGQESSITFIVACFWVVSHNVQLQSVTNTTYVQYHLGFK